MEYKRNLRLGVEGYTDDELSLDVYGNVNVSGNISVAGTVTYDDVTNVDAIGLVTARSGIDIGYPGTATTLTADGNAVFSGIVTAAAFFGDGSGLDGVTGVNIVAQEATGDPVYPTFASNVGVTTLGIAQTGFVYVPSTGYVGIGSTLPASTLVLNAPSGYTGNLLDAQVGGTSQAIITKDGVIAQKMLGGYAGMYSPTSTYFTYFFGETSSLDTSAIGNKLVFGYGLVGGRGRISLKSNGSFAWSSSNSNPANGPDLELFRDAANVLAQRNGTNAQTSRIYNTYTSSTNFERAQVGWTTDVFIVGTEKGSAGGSPRQLELQTDGTTRVAITTDGYVGIGSTQPTGLLDVTGSFNSVLSVQDNSDGGKVVFRPSASSGLIGDGYGLELTTGQNAFQPKISEIGQYARGQIVFSGGHNVLSFQGNGGSNSIFDFTDTRGNPTGSGLLNNPGNIIRFVPGLYQITSKGNELNFVNGTNAQTFRVYNTYTSSTNFERAQVGWSTDVFIVGTEKGSSIGTARPMHFQTDGITRVAITTTGLVGIGSTQPTATLDVNGDVNITGIVTATKFVGQIEVDIINPFLLMGA